MRVKRLFSSFKRLRVYMVGVGMALILACLLATPVFSAALTGITAVPSDTTIGATTTYTITFTTVTPLTVATNPDAIAFTFPAGYVTTGAAVNAATVTQSGVDPTVLGTGPSVVMLSVAADEPAGVHTVVLDGIVNTHTIGTEYNVAVETQDGDNSYAVLDSGSSAAFSITAKNLTVASVAAADKTYDATTVATVTGGTLNGVLAGDIVTLDVASATGAFVNQNAGPGKAVDVSGLALGGAHAANYLLPDPTGTAYATIYAKPINVLAVTDTKPYDGTNTSAGVPEATEGAMEGTDTADWTQTFDTENVGTGKTLTPTGTIDDGNGGANYDVNFVTVDSGAITPRPITVTAVTDTKVYDGNNTSDEEPIINDGSLADGDTAIWTQTFNDENRGSDKPLTPAGSVNDGNGGANYAVTLVTVEAGFITPRPITVTAAADSKVYDKNNSSVQIPTVTVGSVVPGDIPTWGQYFADVNAGTDKTLIPEGAVADGNGGNNYTVTFAPADTGAITPRPIIVTAVTDTKVYDSEDTSDGEPTITEGSLIPGDTATWTQEFDTEDIGTEKTLIPAGTVNDGNGGGNYDVTLVNDTTGAITTRELTVTGITANDKEYDTNANATIDLSSATLNDAIFGDDVQVDLFTAYGEFDDKVAELNKTVTIYSLSLYGDDSANYFLTPPTDTADIFQAPLTVTGVLASNKVYDGTDDATLDWSVASTDARGSDVVTLNTSGASGAFENASAGTSKNVFIAGLTIEGADAANYLLTPPTTTADITPAPLTVTGITAANKVYDGNTDATLDTGSAGLDGIIGLDVVEPVTVGATGAFADKNVGDGKTVTISGVSLDGAHAGNYAISPEPTTTADITAAPLVVTGITAENKAYDATTEATLDTDSAVLVGVVPEDDVTLIAFVDPAMLDGDGNIVFPTIEGATGNFVNAYVGVDKTVNVSALFIVGDDAGNYSLTQPTTTADITPRPITVTADAKTKYVEDPDPELTYQITSGSLAGEDYFSGSLTREAGETAGSYAIQQGTLVVGATLDMIEGLVEYKIVLGANYNMTYVGADLTISTRQSGGGGGGGGGASTTITSLANVILDNGMITDTTVAGSYDGRCTLTIPEGTTALTSSGNPVYGITITEPRMPPPPPEGASFMSLIYEFRPAGATFDPPLILTFKYSESRLPAGVDEADLTVGFYNSVTGEWIILEGVHVDPETNTITALVSHFSAFSVIASTRPAEFAVSNVTVSPAIADIGEPAIVKATVTNSGALSGTYSVDLKVNDAVVETQEVNLSGQSSQEVSFTVSQATAGEYTVSIDGASTLLTVRAPEAPPPPATTPAPTSPAVTTPVTPPAPATTGPSPSTTPPPTTHKPPSGTSTTQPAEEPSKGIDPRILFGGPAAAIILVGAVLFTIRSRRR
jgi:hypothetical protein